ncbi:MAG: hypothetical protein Kow0059_01500 [Candidatus Sumerlaeia bacterium]
MMTRILFALVWLPAVGTVTAAPATITFEESIAQPDSVLTQYCSNSATSVGVRFVDTGRIFTPTVATASPTHALFNDFGGEFDETKQIQIAFTTGQSSVGMKVGLDHHYAFDVTAVLYAYNTETPGTGFLTFQTAFLGSGPTPITQDITVTSAAGDIRSVVLEFKGPSSSQFAIEYLDNLSISTAGPPCVTDSSSPVVKITTPAKDNTAVFPQIELAFAIQDEGTGVADIEVDFLDATGLTLQSFSPCGGTGAPPCGIPANTLSYDFQTYLPPGTRRIRVTAWDYAGHSGEAVRLVDLKELGQNVNLYIAGLEITQATQNFVP